MLVCAQLVLMSSSVCVQYTVTEGTGESLQGCKLNTLHCSTAHHDSDGQRRHREKDNDRIWDKTGNVRQKPKRKQRTVTTTSSGQRRKRIKCRQRESVCLSVPGTVQIPVTANNTCIHHSRVELQSLVIYTPVCLTAYLAVWILHSSLSNLNWIYGFTSRK